MEGLQRVWPKSLIKMGHETLFFIFDIYCVGLKFVTYVMSYTGYAALVNILLKFDLIKPYLNSFRLFSAYLGLLIWAHLGLFWGRMDHFQNI